MEKVKIEVKNHRVNEDPIEVVYWGMKEVRDGSVRVSYEESALTGMEGVHTQIDVFDQEIVLERTGQIVSKMVFRENHRDRFVYQMEVGSMSMVLETEKMRIHKEEDEMNIRILYKLEIAGDPFERNEMSIRVLKHSAKV